MKIIADLHIHSSFSDGRSSPEELVTFLKNEKIEYCSLTDHDTVKGVDRFIKAASNSGLTAFSGLELSCFENDFQVHILGYNIDHNNPVLLSDLDEILKKRKMRMSAILSALEDQNIVVDQEAFFKRFKGPYWGRPHVAQYLIETEVVNSFQMAFDLYLKPGRPAYRMNTGFSVSDGIEWIHKFGGLAVIAHPALYQNEFPLRYWQSYDFDGIELIHPAQKSEKKIREVRKYAVRNRLFVTGGSDFHGSSQGKYIKNGITQLDLSNILGLINPQSFPHGT